MNAHMTAMDQRVHRGCRVEVRLSVLATRELERMARDRACTRSDLVEGLVMGTVERAPVSTEIVSAMEAHGLSLEEAVEFVERTHDR